MFVFFTPVLGEISPKISIFLAFSGSLAVKNVNIHIFTLSWLQILNLLTLLQKKNRRLGTFPWKRSLSRKNQSERTDLPKNAFAI